MTVKRLDTKKLNLILIIEVNHYPQLRYLMLHARAHNKNTHWLVGIENTDKKFKSLKVLQTVLETTKQNEEKHLNK